MFKRRLIATPAIALLALLCIPVLIAWMLIVLVGWPVWYLATGWNSLSLIDDVPPLVKTIERLAAWAAEQPRRQSTPSSGHGSHPSGVACVRGD